MALIKINFYDNFQPLSPARRWRPPLGLFPQGWASWILLRVKMYAKVFEQIFDSSIADDYTLRHFFTDLLVLAEIDGVVDMTREAISARTRIPLDIVRGHITKLEAPDPASRSHLEEGRRIIRIDPLRDWGWKIVNYDTYRKISSQDQRREMTKIRTRKWRNNRVLKNGDASVTHGDASDAMQRQRQRQKKKNTNECDLVYEAYPRKVGRPKAIVAIERQIKKFGFDVVMQATVKYADTWKGTTDLQYCPHPATWFNQERFNDNPETWSNGKPASAALPAVETADQRMQREFQQSIL